MVENDFSRTHTKTFYLCAPFSLLQCLWRHWILWKCIWCGRSWCIIFMMTFIQYGRVRCTHAAAESCRIYGLEGTWTWGTLHGFNSVAANDIIILLFVLPTITKLFFTGDSRVGLPPACIERPENNRSNRR